MTSVKCHSCGCQVEVPGPSKVHVALQALGVLAIVVGVSLFVGSEQENAQWLLKSTIITCGVGLVLYLWGRIGATARAS